MLSFEFLDHWVILHITKPTVFGVSKFLFYDVVQMFCASKDYFFALKLLRYFFTISASIISVLQVMRLVAWSQPYLKWLLYPIILFYWLIIFWSWHWDAYVFILSWELLQFLPVFLSLLLMIWWIRSLMFLTISGNRLFDYIPLELIYVMHYVEAWVI